MTFVIIKILSHKQIVFVIEMTFIPLSATLHTQYQELLERHSRDHSGYVGSPIWKTVGGGRYAYMAHVDEKGRKQKLIGPDSEATRKTLDDLTQQARDHAQARDMTRSIVKSLQAGGLPAMDLSLGPLIKHMADVGTFRNGGILIGTHAFVLMGAHLGVRWTASQMVRTGDVDIAGFKGTQLAVSNGTQADLSKVLQTLRPAPSLDDTKPTRWQPPDNSVSLEFLTPSFRDDENPRRIDSLGVWAQSLHYLDYLLKDPIPAVALYRDGIPVRIPQPARYAIHKIIVCARRRSDTDVKKRKDAAQASILITILSAHDPYTLMLALTEAATAGDRWRDMLCRGIPMLDPIAAEHLYTLYCDFGEDHSLSLPPVSRARLKAVIQALERRIARRSP